MTKAKQRKLLGKAIRKSTGLKLPIAMRVAKLVVAGRGSRLLELDCAEEIPFWCGWDCCGGTGKYHIVGPRGKFVIE